MWRFLGGRKNRKPTAEELKVADEELKAAWAAAKITKRAAYNALQALSGLMEKAQRAQAQADRFVPEAAVNVEYPEYRLTKVHTSYDQLATLPSESSYRLLTRDEYEKIEEKCKAVLEEALSLARVLRKVRNEYKTVSYSPRGLTVWLAMLQEDLMSLQRYQRNLIGSSYSGTFTAELNRVTKLIDGAKISLRKKKYPQTRDNLQKADRLVEIIEVRYNEQIQVESFSPNRLPGHLHHVIRWSENYLDELWLALRRSIPQPDEGFADLSSKLSEARSYVRDAKNLRERVMDRIVASNPGEKVDVAVVHEAQQVMEYCLRADQCCNFVSYNLRDRTTG